MQRLTRRALEATELSRGAHLASVSHGPVQLAGDQVSRDGADASQVSGVQVPGVPSVHVRAGHLGRHAAV